MNSTIFISKYEAQLYTLLRIIAGFLFLWHGSQKLFGFPPAGHEIPNHIVLIAGPIEFIGGLLIMIGLCTHWVAFICSGEMAFKMQPGLFFLVAPFDFSGRFSSI